MQDVTLCSIYGDSDQFIASIADGLVCFDKETHVTTSVALWIVSNIYLLQGSNLAPLLFKSVLILTKI